jgi:hypothetical protein
MVLTACVPRLSALPELRTYRCPACGHVATDAIEHRPFYRRPSISPAV